MTKPEFNDTVIRQAEVLESLQTLIRVREGTRAGLVQPLQHAQAAEDTLLKVLQVYVPGLYDHVTVLFTGAQIGTDVPRQGLTQLRQQLEQNTPKGPVEVPSGAKA